MPKYCPVCCGEYKDSVKVCPKDGEALSDKKPPLSDRFIDIYAASDTIEAERIVAFLAQAGILVKEAELGISQLPTLADKHSVIAVQRGHIKESKALIEAARKDGVISSQGIFL